MRYFIAAVYLVANIIFFIGCKKDGGSSNPIIGTWELRQIQADMPTIDYSPGNGNLLIFSGSGYEKYTNGNLVKSGHYVLVSDASAEATVGLVIPPGQFTNRIIFDDDLVSSKTFVDISNNRLTLLSGSFPADGGGKVSYERIKDNH